MKETIRDYHVLVVPRRIANDGEVEIVERKYKLTLTFNSMADLEEMLNEPAIRAGHKPVSDALDIVFGQAPTFSSMRLVMWFALQKYYPETTKQEAGNIVMDYLAQGGDYNLVALYRELNLAMLAAGFVSEGSRPNGKAAAETEQPSLSGTSPAATSH